MSKKIKVYDLTCVFEEHNLGDCVYWCDVSKVFIVKDGAKILYRGNSIAELIEAVKEEDNSSFIKTITI